MSVQDLLDSLDALSDGSSVTAPVDRVVVGDAGREVRGVTVAWMPYRSVLEETVRLGCNVLVTHEPLFYDHFDLDVDLERLAAVRAKRRLIAEHDLAVIRCHDTWDALPEIGILDSWARVLDLGPIVGRTAFGVAMSVSNRTSRQVARLVAARTRRFGQPAVQLLGDGDAPVSTVAIGTGAITPYFTFIRDLGADLVVCTDDGLEYWREGSFAIDNGPPIIVVNHGVAEEAGMVGLATHLRTTLGDLPVHQIGQGCMFRLVID